MQGFKETKSLWCKLSTIIVDNLIEKDYLLKSGMFDDLFNPSDPHPQLHLTNMQSLY